MSDASLAVAEAGTRSPLSALESLARAARQTALYGPRHSMAAEALQEAWRDLCAQAEQRPVIIGAAATALTWNGQPIIDARRQLTRLHQALRDRLVSSVRLLPGLRPADLACLFVVLSEDPKLLAASGGVMRALGESVGPGLVVEEVDFSAKVGEGGALWLQTCSTVDPEAARSLREVLDSCLEVVRSEGDTRALEQIRAALSAETGEVTEEASPIETAAATAALLIQSAGEAAARGGAGALAWWEQEMLKSLEALGPTWNAYIFRAPLGPDYGNDVLARLAQRMRVPQCVSLVLAYPGAIVTERSEGLERVLHRILADPLRAEAVSTALREEALRRGIPEEIYQSVVALAMPRAVMVEEKRAESEGDAAKQGGPREELADLLETVTPEVTCQLYEDSLLELLELDLNANQYGAVTRAVLALISACADHRDTDRMLRLLARLREEVHGERRHSPGRRAMAMSAITRSGDPEVMNRLVEEIRNSAGERQEQLLSLLACLGEEGMRALCDLARQAVDPVAKPALAALVGVDAPGYMHLRRLLAGLPAADLEHALRVLAEVGDRTVWAQFAAAADRPELAARMTLIRAVRESGTSATADSLVRLLSDPRPEVRAEAAETLGQVQAVDAVPALCYLLGREPDRGAGTTVKIAVVHALGEIGVSEAVPALRELLYGGGILSTWSLSPARMAAVEALARIGTAEAREALGQWRQCRHPRLREACRQALATGALAPAGGQDAR